MRHLLLFAFTLLLTGHAVAQTRDNWGRNLQACVQNEAWLSIRTTFIHTDADTLRETQTPVRTELGQRRCVRFTNIKFLVVRVQEGTMGTYHCALYPTVERDLVVMIRGSLFEVTCELRQ